MTAAIAVAMLQPSIALAVATMGGGLILSALVALGFATNGEVLRPRPREMVAWFRGRES